MEHISVNGERYVKASSIARELGYTADYVGQLARSGKIEAQLVGRSWFVNERSLREHKRDRYRSTAAKSREALKESLQSFRSSQERTFAPESSVPRGAIFNSIQYEPDPREIFPEIPERKREEPVPDMPTEAQDTHEEPLQGETVTEEPDTAESAKDVYKVPIRTVKNRPSLRSVKTPQKRRTEADRPQTTVTSIVTPEERVVVVGKPARGGVVFAGVLSLLIALVGFFTLVGVESKIAAGAGSFEAGYRFNTATVAEALLNLEK